MLKIACEFVTQAFLKTSAARYNLMVAPILSCDIADEAD